MLGVPSLLREALGREDRSQDGAGAMELRAALGAQRRLGSWPRDPSGRPGGAAERAGRAKFPTPALEL